MATYGIDEMANLPCKSGLSINTVGLSLPFAPALESVAKPFKVQQDGSVLPIDLEVAFCRDAVGPCEVHCAYRAIFHMERYLRRIFHVDVLTSRRMGDHTLNLSEQKSDQIDRMGPIVHNNSAAGKFLLNEPGSGHVDVSAKHETKA